MDNKIINSSEYFILDIPALLYRNIGCPKNNGWGFEIKCFKTEDKVIQEIKITKLRIKGNVRDLILPPQKFALLGYLGNNPEEPCTQQVQSFTTGIAEYIP